MKLDARLIIVITLLINVACKTTRLTTAINDDGKIEVVLVQVNDVYEIAPVAGGKEGGMARVASLKKHYYQVNPNTFLVMCGDFLSPSVYNSLQYDGKRIRGAQMIEAMNAAGTDLAVFGNHEFDINENDLQDRINESEFTWVASNTFHKTNTGIVPFTRTNVTNAKPFPETFIMSVRDSDGTSARVGFIGLTLSSNPADYVSYKDPLETAKRLYNQLKDSVDAVIAITHQAIASDVELAKEVPGLAAILGGHEHGMEFSKIGNVTITKAHSNARSAYVVKLAINKNNRNFNVITNLTYLNESIGLDSNTNVVVQKWKNFAEDNYASFGFDAGKIVIPSGEPLEGRETETRTTSTNFTKLITQAMAYACPQADVVIFNSGSLRLDDILTPPISQYDIIRSLPFGGGITEVDMKGSMLIHVMQTGMKNINSGGFLQFQPVIFNPGNGTFVLNGSPIDSLRTYRVAVTDFLMTGKETNLSFLQRESAGIIKTHPLEGFQGNPKSDIRLAIIKYLESKQ